MTPVPPQTGLGNPASRTRVGPQPPIGPSALPDYALFLARHGTQGFSQQVLQEIRQFPGGHGAWVDNQLGLAGSVDDSALEAILADPFYEDLTKTPAQLYAKYAPLGADALNDLVGLVQGATILRGILSKRQLHERMVEFWTDHFNVWINKDSSLKVLKVVEDDQVIRPHAFGKFKEILRASAQSAAMLHYLNGDKNVAGAPNENYAREVMELHTLGVDVLYDERDISEAAKLFTGWTFIDDPLDPQLGDFRFDAANHSTQNPITVLGVPYTAGDVTDGEQFLDDLAALPETAEFVCGKLILWLLGVPLPTPRHDQVVSTFIGTGGDIALTVREIFSDASINAAVATGPGFKRPSRFAVGLVRQLEADIGPLGLGVHGVGKGLSMMGQVPFNWPPPTGYPVSKEAWGSDVYGRWNFANMLLSNQLASLNVTVPDAVIDGVIGSAGSYTELRDNVEAVLLGGAMDVIDRGALLDHIVDLFTNLPSGTLPEQRVLVRDAIVFAASLPSYQLD